MLACIKKSLKNGFDFVLKFVNQLIFYIPSMILLPCKVVSDTCMTSKKGYKGQAGESKWVLVLLRRVLKEASSN